MSGIRITEASPWLASQRVRFILFILAERRVLHLPLDGSMGFREAIFKNGFIFRDFPMDLFSFLIRFPSVCGELPVLRVTGRLACPQGELGRGVRRRSVEEGQTRA